MIKTIPYWSALGKHFYNKMDALRELELNGLDLRDLTFYFFDKEFSQVDWTEEPEDDWEYMLQKRARQLQANYDYIRLWYSGGVDSHTMLNAFLNAGVHIDEIIVHRASPSGEFEDLANVEANRAAIPFLETKKEEELQGTNIRILDIGPKEYLKFYSVDGWQYLINTFEFRPVTLPVLYSMFPDLADPYEKGLRLADVRGGDKPRVRRDEAGFYAVYPDSSRAENVGAELLEDFFLTPHYPKLHVKQCWLLRNMIMKKHPEMMDLDPLYEHNGEFLEDWNGCCRLPLWNNISVGKGGDIYTPKCQVSLEEGKDHNPQAYKLYMGSLLEEGRTGEFKYRNQDIRGQMAGVMCTEYYMGL